MSISDSRKVLTKNHKLIHYPLCPLSRFIRLILSERKIIFSLIEEPYWQMRSTFLRLNPSGGLPVFVESGKKQVICDVFPVFEYLYENNKEEEDGLFPNDINQRSEIRRIVSWFNIKFYHEVSKPLLEERVLKRITRTDYPDSMLIRKALHLLPLHIEYMAEILEMRPWLAGDELSVADFAATAHISVVDFLGNIRWNDLEHKKAYDIVRDWYARIKSRPSFRDLVYDQVSGFSPPEYYSNPDF